MAKSLVEKYEQILAQDPASTVFVELAKALIEQGEHQRAISICQSGLTHHQKSVVGRVLWGKALINLGRPAEAMEQFDKAVAIDRENPHAYNLIGEVLLHKGLYRSALPLLRKAVALQPNDGRVRQWLEQTQRALAGGPAPILSDPTGVNHQAAPAEDPFSQAPSSAGEPIEGQKTEVDLRAYQPQNGVARANGAPAITLELPVAPGPRAPPPVADEPLGGEPDQPTTVETRLDARTDPGLQPAAAALTDAQANATDPAFRAAAQSKPKSAVPQAGPGARAAAAKKAGGGSGGRAAVSAGAQARGDEPLGQPFGFGETDGGGIRPGDLPTDGRGTPAATEPAAAKRNGASGKHDGAEQDEEDPFANVPKRTDSSETIRGLTSTFDALEGGANVPMPDPGVRPRSSVPVDVPSEPSVVPSEELLLDSRGPKSPPSSGGLLDDIPPPSEEHPIPQEAVRMRAAPAPSPASTQPVSRGGGLLDDIPDVPEPSSSIDIPKVELSNQATEAIAQEYERELREKLRQSASKKTFLQKHGLKLAITVTVLVAASVGLAVFLKTRAANQGRDLKGALADAKRGILFDTPQSYKQAFEALALANRMAPSNSEAWALSAYAHAVEFAEHGGREEDRTAAREALKHEGVAEEFPHLVTAANYLLADGKEKDTARGALVASQSDHAEVTELAGRVLLEQGKSEAALEKLKAALQSDPRNVRAMVALANYFLEAEDYAQAQEWFEKALGISEKHPEAIIGTAEARLALRQDADASLAAVQAIPNDGLDAELAARKVLVEGRLLSHARRNDDALAKLNDGAKLYKAKAFEFDLALGEAARAAGQMEASQKSYEAALKLRPKSERAKEALGRILIDRDRPKEVLSRIQADAGERKVNLVRGIAAAQAGDWRTARSELGKTAVSGKVPAEAVIYLALADAADGEVEKAQQVLERALASTKRNKSDVQVALGRVYLQQNKLKEARDQFEAAAADPQDEEGACALGQLLVKIGAPDRAVEPLQKAVARNPSHAEARHALISALLDLGQLEEALKYADAGQLDNPTSAVTQRDYAEALFRNGKMKEADAASARALKYDGNDVDGNRLRAQIQFARGDGKDAMKSLEKANKLNPHDAETFCEIGLALMRQGHADYAMQAFDAAKREGPEAPCATIGPVYARLPGASKASIKDLETVIKQAPSSRERAFALTTLGRVQLSIGSAQSAKKSIDDALQLEPHFGIAHHASALLAMKLKDDDKAKEEFAKATELEPAWAPFRLAYADFLARGSAEDQQKAVAEYEAFLRVGGSDGDMSRVKKLLPTLKKKLAQR